MPALMLPANVSRAGDLVAMMAILAGLLVLIEYNTAYPSFVEFRDAPPLNRIRFFALFAMVFLITVMSRNSYHETNLSAAITAMGAVLGQALDFPYSPVRLVVLMLPETTPLPVLLLVRAAAGLAYVIGLASIAVFYLVVRFRGWPLGKGAFNVWINLPLFEPTIGGDVVHRLKRDGRVNIILGVLLPFIIPAAVKLAAQAGAELAITQPQTLIWSITLWAFLPATMVTRGIAMLRVADLIKEKRRRAYARAESHLIEAT